ncbi:N-acylglucosamine 2-epimerase [Arcticibacter pallidicorallinus]|uniref:N-acylglucosamine 2-epimerase n=1 Tax=Arcticibacter pallidicorallinus TaxID=1259464 RepID=A0A2T0U0P0_9SPHI|nr:AGE family epimerase/isomerase [Arcticibacter pallidicorallinus]PRY51481.1 N-acylglucosamine 2-epimerase [Arcticibacter pallidicorallinus]
MREYSNIYQEELLQQVLPFWMKNSRDEVHGGYFTCLDRAGDVYDTDKFIWLQGRQVWMFSMLYNNVEQREDWLKMALHGADFLRKNGRDKEGNWYFSLNREGKPLVQPYNIFSDCFAAMGFGALYKATQRDEHAEIARRTFEKILRRSGNTKGQYNKIYPGTRELKGFSLPMILSNLSLEIEHILDKSVVDSLISEVVHEVLDVFYNEEIGLALENVYADGSFCDSFEGRTVNPGHNLEAMWFLMDLGVRLNDQNLINKAVKISLDVLEYGWDKEFGGILYFMDIKGHPPQQLEWDQKLWWVHVEALVCMAKAYQLTGNEACQKWFVKLHDYTWNRFRDSQFGGEWFGYLNRRGEVLLPLKGGKWKGCFHVPRSLYQISTTLKKEVLSQGVTA